MKPSAPLKASEKYMLIRMLDDQLNKNNRWTERSESCMSHKERLYRAKAGIEPTSLFDASRLGFSAVPHQTVSYQLDHFASRRRVLQSLYRAELMRPESSRAEQHTNIKQKKCSRLTSHRESNMEGRRLDLN